MLGSGVVNAPTPAPAAAPPPAPTHRLAGINRNIVALGFTSLLTDVSTEMIIPVLPLFITTTLKASVTSLGVIEGVAESTASLLRLGSGWLSDRIGRRKPFLLFGYGLSTVAKATLAIAVTWPAVLGLRFADRVGKGLRNPPRDALIADSVEPRFRGRAYGFHRGLDTLGAAIGPLVAAALLAASPGDLRRVFLWSAVPATLSLVVLGCFVRAPRHAAAARAPLHHEVRAMGAPFARFLVADGLFQLANSSNAFLLLRALDAGFSRVQLPLVYVGYNLAYALLSYPVGIVSDRIGRRRLLVAAYALYALIYAGLAWRAERALVLGAFLLLGLHSALLEVSERSMIADFVSPERRATAFGVYHTVVGLALLPASALAGFLWQHYGARTAFGLDAALALAAAVLFVVLLPARDEYGDRHRAPAA
jgi:MFS family permease